MALLPCYECKSEISTAALSCPKCGAPNKARAASSGTKEAPKTRPIFKMLSAALVALFLYALFSKNDTPLGKQSSESAAISTTAEELAADYKENEVSADKKYKGKRVIVSAVVESVNKDFKDAVWVGLKTDNQFMPVHAEGFSAAQVYDLRRGSVVAIICTGAGMIIGSPFLKNCRLPNNSPG